MGLFSFLARASRSPLKAGTVTGEPSPVKGEESAHGWTVPPSRLPKARGAYSQLSRSCISNVTNGEEIVIKKHIPASAAQGTGPAPEPGMAPLLFSFNLL